MTSPSAAERRPVDAPEPYYAKDGKVWKRAVHTKVDGGTSISIGFPVCRMLPEVGDNAAESVAGLMNAGDRALNAPDRVDAARIREVLAAVGRDPDIQQPGNGLPAPDDWVVLISLPAGIIREAARLLRDMDAQGLAPAGWLPARVEQAAWWCCDASCGPRDKPCANCIDRVNAILEVVVSGEQPIQTAAPASPSPALHAPTVEALQTIRDALAYARLTFKDHNEPLDRIEKAQAVLRAITSGAEAGECKSSELSTGASTQGSDLNSDRGASTEPPLSEWSDDHAARLKEVAEASEDDLWRERDALDWGCYAGRELRSHGWLPWRGGQAAPSREQLEDAHTWGPAWQTARAAYDDSGRLWRDVAADLAAKLTAAEQLLAVAERERDHWLERLVRVEAALVAAQGALSAVKRWAEQKCPCENEQPNPCPLCGASVENLEACKAVDSTFPRSLREAIDRAILTIPAAKPEGE